MNRMEEYRALARELETPPPALEHTLTRALDRDRARRRRNRLLRPLGALAGALGAFVVLVNVSAPLARAVSQVPGLRELAAAVTFSPSLTRAVENQYVQWVEQADTDGDVTGTVEYMIADPGQVNVFYTLESPRYADLDVTPRIQALDGTELESYSLSSRAAEEDGPLRWLVINFFGGPAPESFRLTLEVTAREARDGQAPDANIWEESPAARETVVAVLEFDLTVDPQAAQAVKRVALDRTLELDGQKITLTELEIYPTHLRLDVAEDEGNSAWLRGLQFYVQLDSGETFLPVTNGVLSNRSQDDPGITSYRADSFYFCDARSLTVVVTGAEWLDKDMEWVEVDLKTLEAERMPQDAQLWQARQLDQGWLVTVRARQREENTAHSVFLSSFRDEEGVERGIWSSSVRFDEDGEYFYETVLLADCPGSRVWLQPAYTRLWTAEEPVRLEIW